MDAAVADTVPARAKAAPGTMFVGPVFDYLLIGGPGQDVLDGGPGANILI